MQRKTASAAPRLFRQLLFEGQRVDWKYSLVVVLVITGMFSTPLALGSIRNRVYVAVKEQIEKENNAREVSVQLAREDAPPLDSARVLELEQQFPGLEVVGNHKLMVSIEGPEASDFLTFQTLEPGDPRTAPLQIAPPIPEDFGLTDLVVSDGLGKLLYGSAWDSYWNQSEKDSPLPPLSLRINDLPLTLPFRAVARRGLPGKGLYGSPAAGSALRSFTKGFGAPELGLPADSGLLAVALPKLVATRCGLLLPEDDRSCGVAERERLLRRLKERQLKVEPGATAHLPAMPGFSSFVVGLTELAADSTVRDSAGDCQEILATYLVDACSAALVVPELSFDGRFVRGTAEGAAQLAAATPEVLDELPEARRLADRLGVALIDDDNLALAVPAEAGFRLGETLTLLAGKERVPVRVGRFYRCPQGFSCPWYADPLAVFRLQGAASGTLRLASTSPLLFAPVSSGEEYDELLAYVDNVEDVEATSQKLRELYPGYNVQYNVTALDKLRRQDARLATLFSLTIALSAVFLVLALSALARINIERRSRQIAQMLILGFSRRFVRALVVAEYLLLTLMSSLAAYALTALLCLAARRLLKGTASESAGRDFQVIVDSMNVDPKAFLVVFTIVAVCTWAIALVSAHRAAKSDPLNLLD